MEGIEKMALITCPECGQSISDKALKCPKCGYPIKEHPEENRPDPSATPENSVKDTEAEFVQETSSSKNPFPKGKKNLLVFAACLLIVFLTVFVVYPKITSSVSVKDISINKWRLTDSSSYSDYYEGTVTSKQKKPFVAVIGQYGDGKETPQLVYMENGVGTLTTRESSSSDPSVKYRAIGYLGGKKVGKSDIKVKYTDTDYFDWSYSDSSTCNVAIDIDMNRSKSGILLFDIVNETNNETSSNRIAVVINGKTAYNYEADLPYKTRGIDISIVPKFFCESKTLGKNAYQVEKEFTAELSEGKSYNSYSGKEILSFEDKSDKFILFTSELKEGGSKENRNIVEYRSVFLHDGECTISTYDSAPSDEKILRPKYDFNIAGYISWNTLLEKESI